MKTPHAIVVPYPVQGHVIPHMELSHHLVERGFKITFVNTEFNHKRIVATLQNNQNESQINLVTISDGLTDEDRNDIGKLTEALISVFPIEVEAVIKGINGSNDNDDITCIISDIGWLLAVVGENIGIQTATFWTMGAGILALVSNITKLIETGIINPDATQERNL
ncbi:hypothetical protein AQUCO_00200806v1 [Aquilegia coerulea]|uniref:Uncharacterized protein n=1 Tax=Aquilegia coerulea TaxID=218851 RepID=A0A2G5F501_AQUCA|nr:hypothetical protein AQUCO_00200806v1 [Aquilegia coerulea]